MLYEINAQAVFDVELKIRAKSLPEAESFARQLILPCSVMSQRAKTDDRVVDYNQDMTPTVLFGHHREIPED